ncbi:MBL fold metallo-hydrolase [Rhodococcus opacus]|uniref:MBL fold metallo-hydrolase n=1 Tax=Rhodococcus opacus TaxID=37919 RepID=UPI001C447EE0|nr:MBL fold metallo-hydrolase [Rhodococcus opacus]MBV6760435.1 MBL fold metallo-hydrolase [Rhodococcus opacus]
MCLELGKIAADPKVPQANRRMFLRVLGAAAALGTTAACSAAPPAAGAFPSVSLNDPASARTRLVLLGTAGGPALYGGSRFGVSTAVAYDNRVYLVDLGLGSLQRLRQSSLVSSDPAASMLANVRGIFFTHMHSDHLADWPALYATGPSNIMGREDPSPIAVRGPGPRGTLPRVFPANRPEPAIVNPDDPTPGIVGMSTYLEKAWSTDLNDRVRDNNSMLPTDLFQIQDIDLSGTWNVDPEGIPPRLPKPIQVLQDGEVTVTATLVDHRPAAPAFAYRFDTPDGSIVVSGDTTVSSNLIELSQNVDYLVHEVIDLEFVERITATLPESMGGPLRKHLIEAHTTIEQVGRDVAEPARAKNLVLTHLAPATNPTSRWELARNGYSGNLIVGEDLLEIPVNPNS